MVKPCLLVVVPFKSPFDEVHDGGFPELGLLEEIGRLDPDFDARSSLLLLPYELVS